MFLIDAGRKEINQMRWKQVYSSYMYKLYTTTKQETFPDLLSKVPKLVQVCMNMHIN